MAIYLLSKHLGHDGLQVADWKEWGYVHTSLCVRRENLNPNPNPNRVSIHPCWISLGPFYEIFIIYCQISLDNIHIPKIQESFWSLVI